jgi:hypothetical protein
MFASSGDPHFYPLMELVDFDSVIKLVDIVKSTTFFPIKLARSASKIPMDPGAQSLIHMYTTTLINQLSLKTLLLLLWASFLPNQWDCNSTLAMFWCFVSDQVGIRVTEIQKRMAPDMVHRVKSFRASKDLFKTCFTGKSAFQKAKQILLLLGERDIVCDDFANILLNAYKISVTVLQPSASSGKTKTPFELFSVLQELPLDEESKQLLIFRCLTGIRLAQCLQLRKVDVWFSFWDTTTVFQTRPKWAALVLWYLKGSKGVPSVYRYASNLKTGDPAFSIPDILLARCIQSPSDYLFPTLREDSTFGETRISTWAYRWQALYRFKSHATRDYFSQLVHYNESEEFSTPRLKNDSGGWKVSKDTVQEKHYAFSTFHTEFEEKELDLDKRALLLLSILPVKAIQDIFIQRVFHWKGEAGKIDLNKLPSFTRFGQPHQQATQLIFYSPLKNDFEEILLDPANLISQCVIVILQKTDNYAHQETNCLLQMWNDSCYSCLSSHESISLVTMTLFKANGHLTDLDIHHVLIPYVEVINQKKFEYFNRVLQFPKKTDQ